MTKTLKTMALTVLLATAVLGQTAQAKALTQTAQGVTGYTQTAKVACMPSMRSAESSPLQIVKDEAAAGAIATSSAAHSAAC